MPGHLIDAMASSCGALACAIVVAGEAAAAAAMPAVAAVLADGAGRFAAVPENGPLAQAGFIAVEPLALYGESRARAVVLAGTRADERDQAGACCAQGFYYDRPLPEADWRRRLADLAEARAPLR